MTKPGYYNEMYSKTCEDEKRKYLLFCRLMETEVPRLKKFLEETWEGLGHLEWQFEFKKAELELQAYLVRPGDQWVGQSGWVRVWFRQAKNQKEVGCSGQVWVRHPEHPHVTWLHCPGGRTALTPEEFFSKLKETQLCPA